MSHRGVCNYGAEQVHSVSPWNDYHLLVKFKMLFIYLPHHSQFPYPWFFFTVLLNISYLLACFLATSLKWKLKWWDHVWNIHSVQSQMPAARWGVTESKIQKLRGDWVMGELQDPKAVGSHRRMWSWQSWGGEWHDQTRILDNNSGLGVEKGFGLVE